jgi:hypothetical protein
MGSTLSLCEISAWRHNLTWRKTVSGVLYPCIFGFIHAHPVFQVYWNTHALIFILDASASEHFPQAKEALWLLAKEIRRRGHYLTTHPILIAASKTNKLDPTLCVGWIARGLDIEGLSKWGRAITLKVSCMISCHLERVVNISCVGRIQCYVECENG